MKINKTSFGLALMVSNSNYNGTLNIKYDGKIFNKDTSIEDSIYICEESDENQKEDIYPLTDNEKIIISKINELINKTLDKKGLNMSQWILKYSYNTPSTFEIESNSTTGYSIITFNLIEDNPICKKALSLSRSVVKRILSKLS